MFSILISEKSILELQLPNGKNQSKRNFEFGNATREFYARAAVDTMKLQQRKSDATFH